MGRWVGGWVGGYRDVAMHHGCGGMSRWVGGWMRKTYLLVLGPADVEQRLQKLELGVQRLLIILHLHVPMAAPGEASRGQHGLLAGTAVAP